MKPLSHQPDFRKLWLGQTISMFGSQIGGGALTLTAVLLLNATPAQMGILLALSALPVLLVGLLVGTWVDRVQRRPLLIAADIGRALLLASVPVAALLGMLRMELLFGVAALVGVLTIIFDVAYQAYLPTLVERTQLIEGNSKLGVSNALAEVAGQPVGGLLVTLIGAPLTIVIDAISFLGSALCIWRIRTREAAPDAALTRTPAGKPMYLYLPRRARRSRRMLACQRKLRALRVLRGKAFYANRADVRGKHQVVRFALVRDVVYRSGDGLALMLRQPLLRTILGSEVLFSLTSGVIGSLITLYVIRELGISPAVFGVVVGVGGGSALLGALLAARLPGRFGIGRTMVGALVVMVAATALLPLAAGPLALVLLLLSQAGDGARTIFEINKTSLLQAITPNHLLGRVHAAIQFVNGAALPLGALLGGALGGLIGLRAAMGVGAGLLACAALWVLASPLRALDSSPSPVLHQLDVV